MEENKIAYQIGMRDMLANLFMEIRTNGIDKTLKNYAEILGDNPHAKDFLKKLSPNESSK